LRTINDEKELKEITYKDQKPSKSSMNNNSNSQRIKNGLAGAYDDSSPEKSQGIHKPISVWDQI
jgi:hypothetical protein